MKVFVGADELRESVGNSLGASRWIIVNQEMVDQFAELTGSDDWIHTDPERAKGSPFGGAIVQGDLILSLIPGLILGLYHLKGDYVGMIYGSDRVRLPRPLPVGEAIRVRAEIDDVATKGSGILVSVHATAEMRDGGPPVLSAKILHFYRPVDAAHPSRCTRP